MDKKRESFATKILERLSMYIYVYMYLSMYVYAFMRVFKKVIGCIDGILIKVTVCAFVSP